MAVGDSLPQLPQPGPSQLEILFRRMLLQCLQRTQHSAANREALLGMDWRSDPRFHCVVESLQERLFDLEHNAADRPGPDVLQLYRAQVAALAGELRPPDLPAYCLKPAAASERLQGDTPPGTSPGTTNTASALLQTGSSTATRSSARDTTASSSSGLRQPAAAGSGGTPGGGSSSSGAQVSLSSGAQQRLQTQQRLQDELTSELLDMGQELKASTLAMQNAIRYRGKLLDDAEVSLVDSTANAQAVSAKAKQQHRQGSWNFCQTLLILLAVAIIFSGMIVYIKLTSMVGLKGR